tara:strand:- start:1383 stop:1520 length:138 start_codon:yes stop_codon:yes gene_type:complete
MTKEFEWKKVSVKDVWKHTKLKIHKNKKKYNRKRDGFKGTQDSDY